MATGRPLSFRVCTGGSGFCRRDAAKTSAPRGFRRAWCLGPARDKDKRDAMAFSPHDERFMDLALALGRRGLGNAWPNPAVGAVVVDAAGDVPVIVAAASCSIHPEPRSRCSADGDTNATAAFRRSAGRNSHILVCFAEAKARGADLIRRRLSASNLFSKFLEATESTPLTLCHDRKCVGFVFGGGCSREERYSRAHSLASSSRWRRSAEGTCAGA